MESFAYRSVISEYNEHRKNELVWENYLIFARKASRGHFTVTRYCGLTGKDSKSMMVKFEIHALNFKTPHGPHELHGNYTFPASVVRFTNKQGNRKSGTVPNGTAVRNCPRFYIAICAV